MSEVAILELYRGHTQFRHRAQRKKVITDFAQRLEQVDWLGIERLFDMKTDNLAAMCHAVGLDPRKDLIGLDLREIVWKALT